MSEPITRDEIAAIIHDEIITHEFEPLDIVSDAIDAKIKHLAVACADRLIARIGGGGWRGIETAPRDGTHILACIAGQPFGWTANGPLPPTQTVVHWWGNPGEEGFYTSVNELEPQRPFEATHWKPLTSLPEPPEPDHG